MRLQTTVEIKYAEVRFETATYLRIIRFAGIMIFEQILIKTYKHYSSVQNMHTSERKDAL